MKKLSKERVDFAGELTASDIASLQGDGDLRVLQTSSETPSATWDLLNSGLFANRPDVQLRVYGFYSSVCDLSFLSRMSNVRRFAADCLMKAKGLQHIAQLRNLESLSVGIFDLGDFSFLADLPAEQIRDLFLGATRSKRPSLGLLERFKNLKVLYIEGQQKEIEVISCLASLEDLTLRSISSAGLDFILSLPKLWSLDIKLGGIRNLSALAGLSQIKYLELWQVKGLSDLTPISSMFGLQYLFLQSLRNVTCIPNLSRLTHLRRVYLENMKGLTDVAPVASAPALEEFVHASAIGMEPRGYEAILTLKSMKEAVVWFGSDLKNNAFRQLAAARGIAEYKHHQFSFT